MSFSISLLQVSFAIVSPVPDHVAAHTFDVCTVGFEYLRVLLSNRSLFTFHLGVSFQFSFTGHVSFLLHISFNIFFTGVSS